jgi:flagella basal body P-ring formation protein FlgA
MKSIITLGLGAIFSLAAFSAEAIQLRTSVSVNGERVRLGDLFEGLADNAQREIAMAPAAGRSIVFDADYLLRIAHAYKIDWRPMPGEESSIVTRASRVVKAEEVRQALFATLSRRVGSGRLQLELDNRALSIEVPASVTSEVEIENLYYAGSQGRFTADVVVGGVGPDSRRVLVSGRALTVIEVPVLVRRVAPGELITAADLSWIEVNGSQIAGDVAGSAQELVGHTPRRTLAINQPVLARDVQMPRLVTKGSLVTVVLQTPTMLLTAQGRAMQDGSKGEVIRITNTQSNRIIDALVVGSNQVAVPNPGAVLN